MKTMMLATAGAAALLLAACGPSAEQQAATPPTEQSADALTPLEGTMDPAAKTLDFATKVAKSNMVEIAVSKSAAGKSTNAEVKQLANTLVTAHEATSKELSDWAGNTTVVLPAALDGLDQAKVDNIVNADAEGFDDKYLDTVIDLHEDSVNNFNDYINNGQEAQLKAWASATLPKLQAHLDSAKALRDKLNKS